MQRDLEQENGHSSDRIRQEMVFYSRMQSTRRMGQSCRAHDVSICRKQTPNLPIHESIIQRSAQEQRWWKTCRSTIVPTRKRLKLFFAQLILVNQLSLHGAVAEMCEECDSCHDRSGRPFVEGQSKPSFVPNVMKTYTPLTDDPAQQEDLLQRYQERVERISQQDRVSKFCTDAGFLTTVEVGQYFMTKDTEEFSQFTVSVACRENSSAPKGWIWGNTKIGPVLEVTTCYLPSKYGVEITIESINKDHSHPWVWTSHGLNKLVTNLNNNGQETSEVQFEEFALRLNAIDFASRSMAKAKPQNRDSPSSSTRTVPIGERTWTDVEPQKYSLSEYPVSKQLITLLRHGDLPREDDGAIELWRIKDYLQKHVCILNIGLMKSGKAPWQEEEETRKDFSIVVLIREKFFTSELFKVIQDAILLIFHCSTMY